MFKYFIIISFLLVFMVYPAYMKYKNGDKNIGFFDLMESLSFVLFVIFAGVIEYS